MFWGSGFGWRPEGRSWDYSSWILSKSCLLLLVSPSLQIEALQQMRQNDKTVLLSKHFVSGVTLSALHSWFLHNSYSI